MKEKEHGGGSTKKEWIVRNVKGKKDDDK